MASKRRNMFHKNKTQETTENGGDPVPTPSMGSKRGRLLMRQHRVKKEIELSQAEGDGEPSVHRLVERQSSEPVHRLVERQCSEPAPNLLAVPQQHAYLIKQNSSPHLSQVNPPTTTSSSSTLSTSIPTVHIQAPSSDNSNPIPLTSMRQRIEELRRSTSTPQVSN
ncbi:hypothetical protein AAG570_012170 [Ranatra chinensis]|uniref:Uncharacterized protein n=1 Tax=Ranatra chinensis TaxID=642074 RepID=A0ABD0YIE3_9HEMI